MSDFINDNFPNTDYEFIVREDDEFDPALELYEESLAPSSSVSQSSNKGRKSYSAWDHFKREYIDKIIEKAVCLHCNVKVPPGP
jgi:hypothetical protein